MLLILTLPFNVQAALGYAQFKRINELVGKKRWILNSFKDRLSDIPDIQLNPELRIYNQPVTITSEADIRTTLFEDKFWRINDIGP